MADESQPPTPAATWRQRRRRRWFAIIAIAGSIICAFALLEGVLRLYVAVRGWTPNCYAAHLSMFEPHPILGAELASNFCLQSGVFRITTNQHGLRGPPLQQAKEKGTIRIALLGGSSAFGYLVSDGEEAARILEGRLRSAGHNVEVINAGVPGFNLFQTNVRFEERIAPLDPDIVVLYLGYNDIPYLTSADPTATHWQRRAIAPAWERVAGNFVTYGLIRYRLLNPPATQFNGIATTGEAVTSKGLTQLQTNLAHLVAAIDGTGAELVVCHQVTGAHPDATADLRDALGVNDERWQRMAKIFAVVRKELSRSAADNESLLIDAPREIPPSAENLGDMIHLTPAGEERLAELLAERLTPLIEQRRPQ